jgi:hypothetical protein
MRARIAAALGGKRTGANCRFVKSLAWRRRILLFCKKEAKNFCPWGALLARRARQTRKVFLLLFLQKKKTFLVSR